MQEPKAPSCFVEGCNNVSALTDRAEGKLLVFTVHCCADCYERLSKGERLKIELSRLVVEHVED